jgi:CHAT domain-containing protein/Tfp pilus assembly protein PilF
MSSAVRTLLFVAMLLFLPNFFANAETWKELLDQADSLHKAQNQDSAIVVGEKALDLARKEFGKEDTTIAIILYQIGGFQYRRATYDEAESSFKQALHIWERTFGQDHPDVAMSLYMLALTSWQQGRYDQAELLQKRALAIREKVFGSNHQEVARSLNNLAVIYRNQERFDESEALHKRALSIRENAFGLDHPAVAQSLGNLAIVCWQQGKYLDAEQFYRRALLIREKVLGPEHHIVGGNLHNLGILYDDEGKYAEAELLYKRARTILEKALEPDHAEVARILGDLAVLYVHLGKYADAEPLYKRSLSIFEKILGPEHRDVPATLNNLGHLYSRQEKYDEAEPFLRRALSIWEKVLGPDHVDVSWCRQNLADLYYAQGNWVTAESLYERTLYIREKTLGPTHPYVAYGLDGLANLCTHQGRYAKAELLYKRALAVREEALGPEHPSMARGLEDFSFHYRLQKDDKTSLEMSNRAFDIRQRNFRRNGYVLSERDALTYSNKMRTSANSYLSSYFDAKSDEPSLVRRTSDIVSASKGQVSDDIYERQKSLVTEADSATLVLAESLRYAKFQLSQLFVRGPGEDTSGVYRCQLDSLSDLANELESRLARQSASFRKREDYKNVTAERIVSFLPENGVLLDYLKYDYYQIKPDSSIPRYLVVVLNRNVEETVVDLGEASLIDSLVSDYREHMLRVSEQQHMPLKKDKEEYKKIARKLNDLVIQPVEEHIADKEPVFIASDGGLTLISFAGLIDHDGKYLIERYPIHYLSSGRDLIRLKDQATSGHGLLSMGDPDYDATVETRLSAPRTPVHAALDKDDKYRTRNVRSGCGNLSQLQVVPLPHTRHEIKQVTQQWSGLSADSAIAFFGPQASEYNFKIQAPGKRVIHLATHGYFYEGRCNPEVKHRGFGLDEEFIGENPLLLSGLLFAGFNLHGAGADSAGLEDGVLSAYEVSAMNLEGTDLVVLSACETGLGEVKQGEGVYGLRRAFEMAGARTVVSALWPVSDKATADMMAQLYAESEKSLSERIREAQLAQIKKLRSEGFADHPYNWAGFIALGDWR